MAGSLALIIGTLVSGTTWLAALVTIPVAFAIFFAGVISPNAAGGVNGALLGYVLPVASAGGASTIGPRLAGWWLASVVGTAAVLLLSPKSPGDRLRASATASATALSRYLRAMLQGQAADEDHDALKATEPRPCWPGRPGPARNPASTGWRRPGRPARPISATWPATGTRCGRPRSTRSTPRPSRWPCAARPRTR